MNREDEYLDLAKKAAIRAGDLLLRRFGHIKKIRYKSEKNIVTNADTDSEKQIISMIRKRYPDHSILAEESGKDAKESDYTWVIDPLDGTSNFAYGIPLFGVAIALLKGKETVMGVINIPIFKELFWALKGGGTFLNNEPIRVSAREKLEDMIILYDADFGRKGGDIITSLNNIIGLVMKVRMLGAASVHFSRLLLGCADLLVEHRTKPWDIAAGCLMVEEAGGKVTDFNGDGWNPWSKNLVVSNGKAHDDILRIIGRKPRLTSRQI